jgi:hypothetical protein
VRELPHWRVSFRPDEYKADRIASLRECVNVMRATNLSLRGWDYPHFSNRSQEQEFGESWLASWCDFWGHVEYWRLYQSGQFIHLFAVREAADLEYRAKMERLAQHNPATCDAELTSIRGFIDFINALYTLTEIFEFATRLSQRGLYDRALTISVELKGVKGFVLGTSDFDRAWHGYYAAGREVLGRSWDLTIRDLVSASAEYSLKATTWFFERFGWLDPSLDLLKTEQERFLRGTR